MIGKVVFTPIGHVAPVVCPPEADDDAVPFDQHALIEEWKTEKLQISRFAESLVDDDRLPARPPRSRHRR